MRPDRATDTTTSPASASTAPPAAPPARFVIVSPVSPGLRRLLYVVFALAALLGLNSVWLGGVTLLGWLRQQNLETPLYHGMFLGHLLLGLLFIPPLVTFGVLHWRLAADHPNWRAVRVGKFLFFASLGVVLTGLLLIRFDGLPQVNQPQSRAVVYWLHLAFVPLSVWLYWLHRLAGPKLKWKLAAAYGGLAAMTLGGVVLVHGQGKGALPVVEVAATPTQFLPALTQTIDGERIPAEHLMQDQDCLTCHPGVHERWKQSVHHLSSFNNPAYLASIRETRQSILRRDGNLIASRWCAGCHDPVPLLSGRFDDPEFDDVNDPTATAGITCTVCHAMVSVDSTRGNGAFTIADPPQYPFARSTNPLLRWLSHQLILAKPAFHKQTYLKPFHRGPRAAEFCSTCHKVSLPAELTHYDTFVRGQNHYDSFLLSGVSGHGSQSFYFPDHAKENCASCHMPLRESDDFAARRFTPDGPPSVHDHLFPAANTAIPWMLSLDEAVAEHRKFLDGALRVDLFGVREEARIDGKLHAPLRPEVPELEPGKSYLLETVIRTLKLGHHFTQGTIDSNQIWLEITVRSGDEVLVISGRRDEEGKVDPRSHFVNAFVVDREGNRIERRNPQDIFVKLYDHQIPPGAGSTVHYRLDVPADQRQPLEVEAKLYYRKFDAAFMRFMAAAFREGDTEYRGLIKGTPGENGQPATPATFDLPQLPLTLLASDSITFPIAGGVESVENEPSEIPEWQRWNDYGIGLFLKGSAELRQAANAFTEVERLGRYDGPLNLARVLYREGQLDEATTAIGRAAGFDPAPPPWVAAWLSAQILREQGDLEAAAGNLRSLLGPPPAEWAARGFDFRKDYRLSNLLGLTLFDQARALRGEANQDRRKALLEEAIGHLEHARTLDTENVPAHYNLSLIYRELGNAEQAEKYHALYEKFRGDDNARDRAVRLAREKYPAANEAAEAVVIYRLYPPEAPLPPVRREVTDAAGARETAADSAAIAAGEEKPQ